MASKENTLELIRQKGISALLELDEIALERALRSPLTTVEEKHHLKVFLRNWNVFLNIANSVRHITSAPKIHHCEVCGVIVPEGQLSMTVHLGDVCQDCAVLQS